LDWAGTTLDYGCFAPTEAFIWAFGQFGLTATAEEARAPMGMAKRGHIEAMLAGGRLGGLWRTRHGRDADAGDIDAIYRCFEPALMAALPRHAELLPGVAEAVAALRRQGLRLGSTTGYSRPMMEVLAPLAASQGYLPDCLACPDDVGGRGRPYPYMLWRNLEHLGVAAIGEVLKVGDTAADMAEARHAGCLAVGVVKGSSMLGLSAEELDSLSDGDAARLLAAAEAGFMQAGADYVISEIGELPGLVERLQAGYRPHERGDDE
jgi:phosphonoacetaldehyde hydrolase